MIKETTPLPEISQLLKRRDRTKDLIDPAILRSADFLNSPQVVELLKIRERIGLLGGKLNPVELVTIDNVTAQKARFLEVFGTDDESGVVFSYEKVIDKAKMALKEGLVALGYTDVEVGDMSSEDIISEATAQVSILQDLVSKNRQSIRSGQKAESQDHVATLDRHTLRSKLAANVAMQGLVIELDSTLQLVRGLSQQNDSQIADSISQMYGRNVSPELRSAADQYLLEAPYKAKNHFVGGGTSGLTNDEFVALVLAENKKIPSTAKGVEELTKLKENNDQLSLLYVDSNTIYEAFAWTTEQLYRDFAERTGVAFPEDQKFSFNIGDFGSIDVRDKSSGGKVVCIPKNRIVDLKSLYQLIIHEIESHVLQSYLSDLVVGLGGGMTKPNQEIVYEGLALTRESEGSLQFLGIENKLSENRAFYILAMDEALKGKSFWEVAHCIYDQSLELLKKRGVADDAIDTQAKETAWTIAYRVFRGHQKLDGFDTETAYAFTKDGAYLHGLLLVGQMNEQEMGNIAGVAISHVNALSLLARFDFSDDKMPITYQRHADEYFSKFLHPRLKEYVERTKAA